MERYPTPPSTSSPKHHDHGYYEGQHIERRDDNPSSHANHGATESYMSSTDQSRNQRSTAYSSFTNASTVVPASTEAWASGYPATSTGKPIEMKDFYGITSQDPSYNLPNRHSAPQDSRLEKSYSHSDHNQTQPQPQSHLPAQETYWQATSDPVSQTQPQSQHPYPEQFDPSHPSRPGPPPRRSSSPAPNPFPSVTGSNPYYNPPQQTPYSPSQTHPQPIRRRSSPIPHRIHSPLKRPLSPYSLSRPTPRPGFLKRMTQRAKSLLHSLYSWIRSNPIKTGLLAFIPLLLGTGVVKTVNGVKHFLGKRASKRKEKEHEHKIEKEAKKLEKKWHEDIFGDFRGFAGTKGGPLDGILKIIHMLVNHYCRLSPSSMPRAASILLELYFLDMKAL